MSGRTWGNGPLYSTTAATAANPSTASLIGELILSTSGQDDIYEVRFAMGASTSALWQLEHCLSSGLGSTAVRKQIAVFTGSNQTAEYVFTFRAVPGDRFRCRVASTFTGTAAAVIQAEVLA